MKANYHTHTSRCGHASGRDEQYVLSAAACGFEELGFSDHVPWPYESGFVNPGVRMPMKLMDDYLSSIRALKEKYAGKINILTGFECEYYPRYMNWLAEMKQEKQLDYLILGNHYDESDETGIYFGASRTAQDISRYVRSTIKGIETGLFSYLAHPDLFMRRYPKFDENCRAAAHDLCQACKENNLPLEYNLHDRYVCYTSRHTGYPHPDFFEIVQSYGVDVIIGVDAHEPEEIGDPTQWDLAERELRKFTGSKRIEKLTLR